jgi:hypothetical protein
MRKGIWLLLLLGAMAHAEVPTLRIAQVFSNLDGTMQYVRLDEVAGLDGQNHFAGLTLTSAHGGSIKQYTFPNDLPTQVTAHLSVKGNPSAEA